MHVVSRPAGSRVTGFEFARRFALLLFAVFGPWSPAAAEGQQDPPDRVLILYSLDRLAPAMIRADQAFRAEFAGNARPERNLEVYSEYLDAAGFPTPAQAEAMARYLSERYTAPVPKVIVAVGDNAFIFFRTRREWLFSQVPLVFVSVSEQTLARFHGDPPTAGVPLSTRIGPTLDVMLQLLPRLREVVLISGAGEWEKMWEPMIEAERQRFAGKVVLQHWHSMPLEPIKKSLATLHPDTAVLFLSYTRAPNGTTLHSANVAAELGRNSPIPLFGAFETYLNGGVVGGVVAKLSEQVKVGASAVNHILAGKSPAEIGRLSPAIARPLFDQRELKRWGLAHTPLPDGSEVLEAPTSFLKSHPYVTAIGLGAVLLQAGVIVGLLIHRRRRSRILRDLRLSEARYRTVVDNQTEMVCRYHPDTTLTFVNEAYARFFGRSAESLLGTRFLQLIPPQAEEKVRQVLNELLTTRKPVIGEHEVLRPDGSVSWMEWHDVVIEDESGTVIELQGIGRDVTDRKRAVEARIEAERQLAHASQLALLGELTAFIAHEINQPLGAILSNAEAAQLMLNNGRREEIRAILDDIRKDDLRASEVIRHIRNLATQRKGTLVRIDLREPVEAVMKLQARDAQRRRVEIRTDCGTEPLEVNGDRVQLEQVFFNLILNAMEAMQDAPQERRIIHVECTLEDTSVVVAVSDQGPGIPEDQLARIFESFVTTKQNGMGLGLALVRYVAEAHGGSVTATNNFDGGATICLRLPLAYQT
jgi:PAS domain S-box-containing protein